MAVGFVMVALVAAGLGGLCALGFGAATAAAAGLCAGMLAPVALVAVKLLLRAGDFSGAEANLATRGREPVQ